MDNKIESIVENSLFIEEWKKQMTQSVMKIYPNIDKKDLDKLLSKMLKKRIQIPEVELDNNFTLEHKQSNMISVLDWAIERKPIIAGNGTFYKNQHEAINPIAKMLDDFLTERKAIKKEMFSLEDPTSDLYKDLDRA
jgi:hypothetical protein